MSQPLSQAMWLFLGAFISGFVGLVVFFAQHFFSRRQERNKTWSSMILELTYIHHLMQMALDVLRQHRDKLADDELPGNIRGVIFDYTIFQSHVQNISLLGSPGNLVNLYGQARVTEQLVRNYNDIWEEIQLRKYPALPKTFSEARVTLLRAHDKILESANKFVDSFETFSNEPNVRRVTERFF